MLEGGGRIGCYEVWGRVGGGGMGDVWLGRHAVLATTIVVKTLKPDVGAPGERHARMAPPMRRPSSMRRAAARDDALYSAVCSTER
ncbi:MAG: hypothetical protein ACRENE_01365 [Polyangiaceae bacterium]